MRVTIKYEQSNQLYTFSCIGNVDQVIQKLDLMNNEHPFDPNYKPRLGPEFPGCYDIEYRKKYLDGDHITGYHYEWWLKK